MASRTDKPAVPDLVITADEIAEVAKPYVVSYGGQLLRFKQLGGLSVDDVVTFQETAEGSIKDALVTVAIDEVTAQSIGTMPIVLLGRIFDALNAASDVTEGESGGSGDSSQSTGPTSS